MTNNICLVCRICLRDIFGHGFGLTLYVIEALLDFLLRNTVHHGLGHRHTDIDMGRKRQFCTVLDWIENPAAFHGFEAVGLDQLVIETLV